MIADADRRVSQLHGLIHPLSDPAMVARSVFLIDPASKVRLIPTYPPSTVRNFSELPGVIDSIRLTDNHCVSTPVNWTAGEPVMISLRVSAEEAGRRFPQGFKSSNRICG